MDIKQIEQIKENEKLRHRAAFEDPLLFSLLYLPHHFKYPLGPLHLEMFHLIRHPYYEFIAVMAFRESGKSTILNMANVLWSILGKPEKKFVIIISKTQEQAKNHFANIKAELQYNELLKQDFGPFTDNNDEWNKLSLELTYHGSKIMSVSRDQSIRGLKYDQFRPDLIICDDIEDTASVVNLTERESLYQRFQSEIIPLGNEKTRIVVLGNLLSKDSFMMRLKNEFGRNINKHIFRAYPLLDDRGKILWPGKFPNLDAIRKLRAKVSGNSWSPEYLLDIDGHSLSWIGGGGDGDSESEILTKISLKHGHKFGRIVRRYGYSLSNSKLQIPLIKAMRKYSISAPIIESIVDPGPEDPRYARYLKYNEEFNKILKIFVEELEKEKCGY